MKKDSIRYNEKNAVPFFTSESGSILRWRNSNIFVEKEVVLKTRKIPFLILPRGLGSHFCCYNEIEGFSSSFVEVYEEQKLTDSEKLNIWLFCNSSLLWALREFTGRCNLGGGMLKAEATDLKSLPLCFDFDKSKEIEELFADSDNQKFTSQIERVIDSDFHKKIDKIVFDFFELDSNANFVTELLISRYNWRNKKSKTR